MLQNRAGPPGQESQTDDSTQFWGLRAGAGFILEELMKGNEAQVSRWVWRSGESDNCWTRRGQQGQRQTGVSGWMPVNRKKLQENYKIAVNKCLEDVGKQEEILKDMIKNRHTVK